MEKPTARRRITAGAAVVALSGAFVAAENVLGFIKISEPADKQIEFAVVVVVKPNGARRPAGRGDAGFFGDVGEGAVSVVAVKNAAAILGDVQIGKTVAVVVTDSDTHTVAASGDAGFFGDVGESSIAVILIECVAQRRIGIEEIAFAAVDEINVHPAVVVVVEEGAARACGFRKIVFRRTPVYVSPGNSGFCGRNFFEQSWFRLF